MKLLYLRNDNDYYPTSLIAFIPLLQYLPKHISIWEPACGDGRLITTLIEYNFSANGSDINKGQNFLHDETQREAIITNPPFSWAIHFCDHAIKHTTQYVCMLLRLNFLAGQCRREWYINNELTALFVLSKRPSFTGGTKTDMTDYAWFLWDKTGVTNCRGIYHL